MFQIDALSRTPVYEQLIEQIEKFIVSGILKPGDQLPSVRSLSMDLSVNPNTIQKALTQLATRQIIYPVPGRGSYIANDALEKLSENNSRKMEAFSELVNEFMLIGVPKEELLKKIENIYDRRK